MLPCPDPDEDTDPERTPDPVELADVLDRWWTGRVWRLHPPDSTDRHLFELPYSTPPAPRRPAAD